MGAAMQDALSARNDLLERLLAMQEQQAQQNTNSIVETEEVCVALDPPADVSRVSNMVQHKTMSAY